jgi:ABC-type Mn2+/Zn2+ transport system permease subunit
METILEIFDPAFLSRNSVYISLLVGFVVPLVGVYLVLRRVVFLGVALPQVSSCGIAFAFALQGWGWIPHAHDSAQERAIALAGSIVFTIGTILVLSVLERRGRGLIEGRTGLVYVMAGAWSILLLVKNPFGQHGMLELLRGEIIAVSNVDLLLTGGTFLPVVAGLVLFQKEFLLVSYDRDMAVTLKKQVMFWDSMLFAFIGLTISVSVMSVGPLVAFGFLLLPPLIAYQFARNTMQFLWLSSVIGGIAAVAGFAVAYAQDLPVGPTDLALLGFLYAVTFLGRKGVGLYRERRMRSATGA